MADNVNPFSYSQIDTGLEAKAKQNAGVTAVLRKIVDAVQAIVFLGAIFIVLYLFFIIPTQVDGISMFPNFKNDQVLLANRLIQLVGGEKGIVKSYDYQRGDIIVYSRPDEPDLIKRIIGLPGERVMISGGRVYVEEIMLTESYINHTERPTYPGTFIAEGQELVVPDNSYFSLGDNRTNSIDSRDARVGFVKRAQIKGSPFFSLTEEFGGLSRPEYSELNSIQ